MTQGYKTGGRAKGTPNKATASIREAAQQYTETAIQTLVEVMSDETAPHAARVAAANSLLDRGHGKITVRFEGKSLKKPETKKV
jgi:hypothetical protein